MNDTANQPANLIPRAERGTAKKNEPHHQPLAEPTQARIWLLLLLLLPSRKKNYCSLPHFSSTIYISPGTIPTHPPMVPSARRQAVRLLQTIYLGGVLNHCQPLNSRDAKATSTRRRQQKPAPLHRIPPVLEASHAPALLAGNSSPKFPYQFLLHTLTSSLHASVNDNPATSLQTLSNRSNRFGPLMAWKNENKIKKKTANQKQKTGGRRAEVRAGGHEELRDNNATLYGPCIEKHLKQTYRPLSSR